MKLKQGKVKNIERLPWVHRQSLSRRNFLQAGGMGLLGATLILPAWTAIEPTKWRPAKLSMQLYTVRNQMSTDIPGSLKRVRPWAEGALES